MSERIDSIYFDARHRLMMALGLLIVGPGLVFGTRALAQDGALPGEPDREPQALYSAAELEELVGPVALYPDDLIGIVLPASTYPLQIVQAARFLEDYENDPSLEPDAEWDDSVVALLNYPEVLRRLNDDLDWAWDLGEAVLNQQPEVVTAIQAFRERAYTAGNLQSDERQIVRNEQGAIEIAPADPQVIYVPYYEPQRVIVYHAAPVYHYYPFAYPVYYYPYPIGYSFASRFFWGVTTAFTIGWHTHDLHVRRHGYFGHPYYGHRYHRPFYTRYGIGINVHVARDSNRWQPGYRHGARPHGRTNARRIDVVRADRLDGTRSHGRPSAERDRTFLRGIEDRSLRRSEHRRGDRLRAADDQGPVSRGRIRSSQHSPDGRRDRSGISDGSRITAGGRSFESRGNTGMPRGLIGGIANRADRNAMPRARPDASRRQRTMTLTTIPRSASRHTRADAPRSGNAARSAMGAVERRADGNGRTHHPPRANAGQSRFARPNDAHGADGSQRGRGNASRARAGQDPRVPNSPRGLRRAR